MDVTKLKEFPETVKVDFAGQKATLHFKPNAISAREWRQLQQRAATGNLDDPETNANVALLSRLLTGWDLTTVIEGKKTAYPLTREGLDDLPPMLLDAMVKAISETMFPKPATETLTGSFS